MNVTGRIKEDTINVLFAHYFPHFAECENLLDEVVRKAGKGFNKESPSNVKGIFSKLLNTRQEEVYTKNATTVSEMIQNGNYSFPYYDRILEVDMAIRDLKHVFEVKAVAKRSQGFLMGDRNTLLALERVVNNIEYYEELKQVINEILD